VVALGVVDAIWERLEGVRRARSGLTSFHSLIGGDGQARGLLEQLLDQVYSKEQTEMASLHHHSAGLGAMLRSGLGWLGSAPSAPHPRESPWVIVWVVGGITAGEAAMARRAVAGTASRLTLGGSSLLSPGDVLRLALTHDCLV